MTASVYMALMGESGMKQAAKLSVSKAHYLASELNKIPGLELKYKGEFFNEFVTKRPAHAERLLATLEVKGILGGLPIDDGILWCATEVNTKESIDRMINLIKDVVA
jgi:glycine dehydrogenase subunit 1